MLISVSMSCRQNSVKYSLLQANYTDNDMRYYNPACKCIEVLKLAKCRL